jgi:hypothetical protein
VSVEFGGAQGLNLKLRRCTKLDLELWRCTRAHLEHWWCIGAQLVAIQALEEFWSGTRRLLEHLRSKFEYLDLVSVHLSVCACLLLIGAELSD